MIDIRKLLEKGYENLGAAKAEKEAKVKGHPRIGTVGIVAEDGNVYGVCHRKALARSFGIEEQVELKTRLMWAAGERNEDSWADALNAAGSGLAILRHDEVGIAHKIDGVEKELFGHPDIVLAEVDPAGDLKVGLLRYRPLLGIELKGVFGYSTACSVFFENRPKNDNLIQSAAYSHFKNIPYTLVYTSSSYIPVPIYDKKYGVKTLEPFVRIFYMEWRDDTLYYRPEAAEDWVKTAITKNGIEDYYRLVAEMPGAKNLANRPTANYVDGKAHRWGERSDCKFCPFSGACDQYDNDKSYDNWLANITVSNGSKKENE